MVLTFERTELVTAFATTFFVSQIKEFSTLNYDLKNKILEKEVNDAGLKRSNVGGWHSNDDLFEWSGSCIEELKEIAIKSIRGVVPRLIGSDCKFNLRLVGWANVSRYGAFNKVHNHPLSQISAVYYVDSGDPTTDEFPESGTFEFLDPRPNVEMSAIPGESSGRAITIQPIDGRLVVFPSWLYHRVNPYFGKRERISISFNAIITDLKLKSDGAKFKDRSE